MTTAKKAPARKTASRPAKAPAAAGRGAVGEDGLSVQKRLFVVEYLKDRNASAAAARAGYSAATARQQGSRLLKDPAVRAALNSQLRDVEVAVQLETGITLAKVVKQLARHAFFDVRKLFDEDGNPRAITDLDDDTAAAVAGLDVQEMFDGSGEKRKFVGFLKKWKLVDSQGALDKLMKHVGGYREDNSQKQDAVTALLAELAERRSAFGATRQTVPEDFDDGGGD